MNLFNLYEKSYYYELKNQESLNSRLQIPLAILIALIGSIAYMINEIQFPTVTIGLFFFTLFILFSIISLIKASLHFKNSFYGIQYEYIPTPDSTENYKIELNKFYENENNCEEIVDKQIEMYLYNYYKECSSANATSNEQKMNHLHKTNKYLIITSLFVFVSSLCFYYYKTFDDKIITTTKVEISNPIKIEGQIMSKDSKTPPPPPPKRVITEGRDDKPKKPEKKESSDKKK